MKPRKLLSRLTFGKFGKAKPVVAVLPLTGVIGQIGPIRKGLSLATMAEPIERAFKLTNLVAVVLSVNSPGGSPVQSALIYKRIRALAAKKEVPVITFAEDIAASGGYWLACAGDEIFADESSLIGSIGVITTGFGFTGLIERIGVERRLYKSGEHKSLLDPFLDENPDDVARLRAIQVDVHEAFRALVRARRGDRLKAREEAVFNGDVWTGRRALEIGLIDGIGDVRSVMRERYGEDVKLELIEEEKGWLKRRLGLGAVARHRHGPASELIAAAEERLYWGRYGL
jgi:signal peptide peptidase SppA